VLRASMAALTGAYDEYVDHVPTLHLRSEVDLAVAREAVRSRSSAHHDDATR
jgi:hypothetical protein